MKLEEAEKDNKTGEKTACFTEKDWDWFQAEKDVLSYIRQLLAQPKLYSLESIEWIFAHRFYAIGRRARAYCLLREKGEIRHTRIILRMRTNKENGKPISLPSDWRYTDATPLDEPWRFFNKEKLSETIDNVELFRTDRTIDYTRKEVATLAYTIEGDALVIDDFLVGDEYKGKGIASWLFELVASPLIRSGRIKRIRFGYKTVGAHEFLFAIARSKKRGLLIGPLQDKYGEFYLPGSKFNPLIQADEKVPINIYNRLRPDVLVDISRSLLMATDPDLSLDEAMGDIGKTLDRISEAAACQRLNIYMPLLDESIEPALNEDQRHLWRCSYKRGTRPSRIAKGTLPGEKHLLELMAQGKIEPLDFADENGNPISRFYPEDGMWLIFDRAKLHEKLQENPETRQIIAQDEGLLESDYEQYGEEEGNCISYAYAADSNEDPLFLFAIIGKLHPLQVEVIRSGLFQARHAAERIRLIHRLERHYEEHDKVLAKLRGLELVRDRLAGFFHAIVGCAMVPAYRFKQTGSKEGKEASKAQLSIEAINKDIGSRLRTITQIIEELENVKEKLEPGEKAELPAVSGARKATRSIVNVFYQMLVAESVAELRSYVRTYLLSEESRPEDVKEPLEAAIRYQHRLKALRDAGELLNGQYKVAMEHYNAISEGLKKIPEDLKNLRANMLGWKENKENRRIFELLEAIRKSKDTPPEAKANSAGFIEWIRTQPEIKGRTLSKEERRNLIAASIIEEFIPVLNEFISIAPGMLRLEVVREKRDIVSLVKESITLGTEQAKVIGVRLVPVHYAGLQKPCEIMTDPALLKPLVIADLITNAIKYNKTGGEVKVELAVNEKAGFVRVSVTDTGVGIKEDEREEVFKREMRLEKTKDRPGTGLGLYLASRVAKWLGGHLVLEDSIPGKGSTFTLYLPLAGRETVWPDAVKEKEYLSGKLDLLNHVVNSLELMLSRDLKRLPKRLSKLTGNEQSDRELLRTLYENILKARQITAELSKEAREKNLSFSYFVDTLYRRIHPLLDADKLKETQGALQNYYESCGKNEYAGTTQAYDEYVALIKDTLFDEEYTDENENSDASAHSALAKKIDKMSKPSWVRWLIKAPFIPAILAHELAHYIMAKVLGIELEKFNWKSFFSEIEPKMEGKRARPSKGFYLAGPIVNGVLIAISVASLILLYSFCNNAYIFWPLVILSWWSLVSNLVVLAFEIFSREGDFYKAQTDGLPPEIVSKIEKGYSDGRFFAKATFEVTYSGGIHMKYCQDLALFSAYLAKHGITMTVGRQGDKILPANVINLMILRLQCNDRADVVIESQRELSNTEVIGIFGIIARSFAGLGISEEDDFCTLNLSPAGKSKGKTFVPDTEKAPVIKPEDEGYQPPLGKSSEGASELQGLGPKREAPEGIEANIREIAPRLVNTLGEVCALAKDRKRKIEAKVVLAIDKNLAEGQTAEDALKHVISSLRNLKVNNEDIIEMLGNLTVVYCKGENLAKNLKRRANSRILDPENDIVIAVTAQDREKAYKAITTGEKSFGKENVFVTQMASSRTYIPLVEAIFFSALRVLVYYGEYDKKLMWQCYKRIPYVKKINFAEFKKAYFDDDKPKLSIYLDLKPPAKFSADLGRFYRKIAQIIRNA